MDESEFSRKIREIFPDWDWSKVGTDEVRTAAKLQELFYKHVPVDAIHEDDVHLSQLFYGLPVIMVPGRGEYYWFEVDRIWRLTVNEYGAFVMTFKDGVEILPTGANN